QEKQQVDRGREKIAREQEVVQPEEPGVGHGQKGGRTLGDVQPYQPADPEGSGEQTQRGEDYSRAIQMPRAGDCQIAACNQPKERELEETLDANGGAGWRAGHLSSLASGLPSA